jgi:tetratricopeptide (TPR) repeat protein
MVLALSKLKKYIAESDEYVINLCNPLIEKDPTNRNAYYIRGDAKSHMQDYKGAIQDYSKCIELDPNFADAYCDRADAMENLKNHQGAIPDYNKCIESNPGDLYRYFKRADAKKSSKDYQGAIRDYNKCIELDPNNEFARYLNINYYFSRGKIYQIHLNDVQAAKKDFEKVILMNDNVEPIAFSNYYLGEKEKAFNLLDKTLKDAGADIEKQNLIYYWGARLYSIDGNQAEALKSLKNALEKGYNNYSSIEDDEDLDNIRNSPEFKDLINTYKNK